MNCSGVPQGVQLCPEIFDIYTLFSGIIFLLIMKNFLLRLYNQEPYYYVNIINIIQNILQESFTTDILHNSFS